MKKAAGRGTWKTPPQLIYAEPGSANNANQSSIEEPSPMPVVPRPNLGTKGHLLGLGSKISGSPSAYQSDNASPAGASLSLSGSGFNSTGAFSSYSLAPLPPPPPPPPLPTGKQIANSSTYNSMRTFGSPAGGGSDIAKGAVFNSPVQLQQQTPPAPTSGRGRRPTSAATSTKARSPTPGNTPNKTVELARLRQLAKLRREIQKDTTDSLELEMAELCEVSAYLSACGKVEHSEGPYGRIASVQEANAATREALNKAVGIVKASANSTRSHDSHYQELETKAVPEAHATARFGDEMDMHLACVIGTRREAQSLVPERRQTAVLWAAQQVKQTISELVQDAYPVAGILLATGNQPSQLKDELLSVLNLSPSQVFALNKERDSMQNDLNRIMELQNSANILLNGPLWLPHTEALVEKLRDSMTIQQMAQMLAWTNISDDDLAGG